MRSWVVVFSLGAALGCARQIGDDCSLNSDCGTNLICDTSQPDGYCTQSPCRSDNCPSEAECVTFGPQVTYCMRLCNNKNPCRGTYFCVENFTDYLGKSYEGFCDFLTPEPVPATSGS